MRLGRAATAALLMGWVMGMADVTAAETKAAQATTAPYGTWASPITAARLAGSEIRLGDLVVDGGAPYWLESRPAEKGRYAVVTPDGASGVRELTGPEINVRTRVHEYGGGALLVSGGRMYFSNFSDQRLYTAPVAGGVPEALTPPGYRYADCVAGAPGHLYCVREDHSVPGEAKNALVSLAVDKTLTVDKPGDAGAVLFGDSDFVAYPRPSPDGKRLAWIAWSHPNMPWDTTTLYVATVTPGGLTDLTVVAGGHDESVMEPQWDADGTLYFLSDRGDWWNLHAWSNGAVRAVTRKAAEFGGPLWNLGQSNYALTGDGHAVARYGSAGVDTLAVVDLKTGALRDLPLPFVAYGGVKLAAGKAVTMAYAADQTPAVISVDLKTGAHTVLRRPAPESLDTGLVSRAKPIEFPTAAGPDGHARTAHAFYYAPANPGFRAPAEEKPPLLVKVHGGPTSASRPVLDLNIQYWTSRGFAVVDVNYGGSTGYGRAYRNRLRGNWGVTDVQDATAVVAYLDKAGLADASRAAIRGGSAGGYTTLAALAFTQVFKAGANYYGVSDMESLAKDTHKFESRYLDSLVAPYPAGKAVYDARSPLHHLDGFSAPLITFQGSEDAVVPPAQSRSIVAALKSRGVPVAYIEFEGEQHGFRKADSIIRAQEAELYFYGRIFGFTPADALPPVAIDNLK